MENKVNYSSEDYVFTDKVTGEAYISTPEADSFELIFVFMVVGGLIQLAITTIL